ncbi:glucan ABC transporter ATP-binding protein/ permease [Agrobacterium larrymoorei]|uniref:Glucan ABC transporter ATP-binding protein/ permease n=1 Tax=Agrobacterium larrymoorei TaxID=160699 RepID=A0A4D7DYD9_9HYPH|nr:glucan ABC transporter ATP-binding protein/ permease [Agrobacterium larrymoorei]QCI96750.1 glucan ABC transporter ATP-binding protein/ permease [Agrobacterium larrymoorei]QYA07823.1 glucan ABC transporter ATP-binding protein/ permease [Agrobacterium larrymoorei]
MTLFQVYMRAMRYLSTHKWRVTIVVIANVILAAITIAEPVLFGRIIDGLSSGSIPTNILIIWGAFALFNTVAYVAVAREADRLAHGRRASLLTEAFGRIISMPLSWHHLRGTSNALHTLLRASETLFGLWLEFMRTHLATFVALAFLIPTAISMDLRLSLVLITLGIFYWFIGKWVMNRTKEGQASVEEHYHTVFAHVSDSISNVSVLHSYNRIEAETKALKSFTDRLLSAQYPVLDWWAFASALNRTASSLSMLIILVIGSILVKNGELKVGDVIAFIGFANLLIGRLDQIRAFATQIFEARAKLVDFFKLEDSVQDREEPSSAKELGHVEGTVEFREVNFGFAKTKQGVHDVSFTAKAGQTVAIVGPTGAGKTTLINLLQRVYDPNSGQILVDGIDISTVTRQSLRNSIATVFQDAGLLNRTIRDNIRLGRDTATDDEIAQAAAAAAATDFIDSRLNGYMTQVGERGNRLSGGERQRIAIARAVLKNAPILVLDEATSALDVETEARVKEAVDALRKDRTTFIIAHRLSTVRDADLVLFMDNGRIIEKGTFDELSMRGGRFTSLLKTSGLVANDEKTGAPALTSSLRQADPV